MSLFRNIFLLSVLFLFNFKLNASLDLNIFNINNGQLQERIPKKRKD